MLPPAWKEGGKERNVPVCSKEPFALQVVVLELVLVSVHVPVVQSPIRIREDVHTKRVVLILLHGFGWVVKKQEELPGLKDVGE